MSNDDPAPPAVAVGEVLTEADETLAVAESATGGLVCSLLTDVPGSSAYLNRGYVTYAYEAKSGELGVSREALDEHGAVSEPVARAMARGARDSAGTDWAVSVTGIAGPGGASDEKPVGRTYIGVAHAAPWGTQDSWVTAKRYTFEGDRMGIKRAAAEQALTDLVSAIQ